LGSAPSSAEGVMDKAKRSILVVDDEESLRKVIIRKLEAEGYACAAAADGREALETACTGEFDLVLLDIMMPGMSGMEVLSRVTAAHPDTGVVMITAVSDAQTTSKAIELGACDYVTKPFSLAELSARVERAFENKELAAGPSERED
jgi:two-component system OmpR family response regulator